MFANTERFTLKCHRHSVYSCEHCANYTLQDIDIHKKTKRLQTNEKSKCLRRNVQNQLKIQEKSVVVRVFIESIKYCR